MATIYDQRSNVLEDHLSGCCHTHTAYDRAVELAAQRGEDVVLADDDGDWLIGPSGYCAPHNWAGGALD